MTQSSDTRDDFGLSRAFTHQAVDDQHVGPALSGLIRLGGFSDSGLLHGIHHIGGYIAGSWRPGPDGKLPGSVAYGRWTHLVGRIGAVALRAAAPATLPDRRERLLALLECWAQSPFSDLDARMRTGVLDVKTPDRGAARDENGSTIVIKWGTWSDTRAKVFQYVGGPGEPPTVGGALTQVTELPCGTWGDSGQLRTLVALVRERGPMPWDAGAVALLAESTGMSRAAAALTLAGLQGHGSFTIPFLDGDQRRILGLKVSEGEAGRREHAELTEHDRLDLLAGVLPDDPADLWQPDGPKHLAARIAEAWVTRHGLRPVVPESTLALLDEARCSRPPARVCAAFADPAGEPLLARDLDTWLRSGEYGAWLVDRSDRPGFHESAFRELLSDVAVHGSLVYEELPAGDPVRDGFPALVAALRERLDHPGLLLSEHSFERRSFATEDAVAEYFGPTPYAGPEELDTAAFDFGAGVVSTAPPQGQSRIQPTPKLFVRPAALRDQEAEQRIRQVLWANWTSTVDHIVRARSEYFDRIAARIRDGGLPPGAFEANPATSAPDTVAAVASALGLDTDAAVLYLQLLAMAYPEDRRVRRWNGWSAVRHRTAAEQLVTTGLVLRDKRARAGRGVFLPGEWATSKDIRPFEAWKADFIGARLASRSTWITSAPLPTRSLPERFADVWAAVDKGEGPAN